MSHDEIRSIITIALMAAFADGMKDERERAAVKQLADALDSDGSLNLAALYRDVLMARPDLATVQMAREWVNQGFLDPESG